MAHGNASSVPHLTARIVDLRQETPSIKSFVLAPADQAFAFRAGQWLDLFAEIDGQTRVGGYSMTSSPMQADRFELAIQYSPRHPVTRWLHETARVGDEVVVSVGQGPFFFEEGMSPRLVLLGAGIGVTPLVSIYRYAHELASVPAVTLVHSVSEPAELLFRADLERIAQMHPGFHYIPTVTRGARAWTGYSGRIDASMLERLGVQNDARYYFCGAREFIEDMNALLTARGVQAEQQVFEKWW